ncbi:sigma 54-interacting transcriptional regulator [Alteribacillus sp. YIM 98480]|uniref:sigma 54-interacting transcriptional regulator n=1 Tax=Alteribacillus sp. YIM 98480 TaxID=2606599 RepID=UPI00131DF5F7|nr:sigma 54-interacting transcriptional regulator [Alteribacillus sp. YIM 98480]
MNKEHLKNVLIKNSIVNANKNFPQGTSAAYLVDHFQLDRSAASRLLNEFVHKGEAIKINSRPVLFYDKKTLESVFDIKCSHSTFKNEEEFHHYFLPEQKMKDPFKKFIGSSSNIINIVEQCKTAISYPPNGLPILLTGDSGVGKSYLAQLIYEYALNKKLIPDKAKFVTFNCAEYADNPELITSKLFGYEKGAFTGADTNKTGVIEEADEGILFLDEAHRLSAESQEKLFLLMDKGVLNPLGNNQIERNVNVRIILATTEAPKNAFLPTFFRRIPVVIHLPSFDQRSLSEKISMIVKFYKDESEKLKKQIKVQKNVINTLVNYNPPGNTGELKNIIMYSCARSFQDDEETNKNPYISVRIKHLPESLINEYIEQQNMTRYQYQGVISDNVWIDPSYSKNTIESFLSEAENCLNNLKALLENRMKDKDKLKMPLLLEEVENHLEALLELSLTNDSKQRLTIIEKLLSGVMEISDYILYPNKTVTKLARYLLYSTEYIMNVNIDNKLFYNLFEEIYELFPREINQTLLLAEELENALGIEMNIFDQCITALYLRSLETAKDNNKMKAVIVCHGEKTASSIAGVANRLLNRHIFQGFDMPTEVSMLDITKKINQFLKSVDTSKGVIVFVDMGSLTQLSERMENVSMGPIGLVNNITTSMAIEAGEYIVQEKPLKEIVEKITVNQVPTYQYIKSSDKKMNVIVTTCDTGVGTAVKFRELLEKGFENCENIKILAHDFLSLKQKGLSAEQFQQYNVLGIVGTVNPEVHGIPFVAIEDIITGENQYKWYQILDPILPKETISHLNKNILKLFSIQSVIDHLTILNPDKIIHHVDETITVLQEELDMTLTNSSKISLYVHLSCLIERLVKKQPIETYHDMEALELKHQYFIHKINDVFKNIELTYGVTVPTSEIGYIYDIIKNTNLNFQY